jgi:hypothetical protein
MDASIGEFGSNVSVRCIRAEAVSLDHKHVVFEKSPCCKHRLPMGNQSLIVYAASKK